MNNLLSINRNPPVEVSEKKISKRDELTSMHPELIKRLYNNIAHWKEKQVNTFKF
jgi:hypothetical protein